MSHFKLFSGFCVLSTLLAACGATPQPLPTPTVTTIPTISPDQFDPAAFEQKLIDAIKADDLETAKLLLITVPDNDALLTPGCFRAPLNSGAHK